MWIPKGAAFIRGQRLSEARRLLEEIRYILFFTIYETLFKNVIQVLPTICQNKFKIPEKIENAWFIYKKQPVVSAIYKLFQYNFWQNCLKFSDKMDLAFRVTKLNNVKLRYRNRKEIVNFQIESLIFQTKLLIHRKLSCFNESPLKNYEKCFLFHLKSSLYFCLEYLVMYKKQLDQKDKVNFETYDVTTWFTNTCNTDFVQYLTK